VACFTVALLFLCVVVPKENKVLQSRSSLLPSGNRCFHRRRRLSLLRFFSLLFMPFLLTPSLRASAPSPDSARETVTKVVLEIQRADYEGDRPALKRLYDQLAGFITDKELASRVHYWRGFALWRRAINGFNETPTPKDLAEDLNAGESEFDVAIRADAGFVDAKVGAASCILLRAFLEGAFSNVKNPDQLKQIMEGPSRLLNEASATEPDNPRLLWVIGPNQWNSPPASVGQAKAMETYQKGLESIRKNKNPSNNPLNPSWGEPELLMNLAWSNLNRAKPDLPAAEQYARSALKLVPYWHYVRDILLPQILEAKARQT
jgi:hypothetical protein